MKRCRLKRLNFQIKTKMSKENKTLDNHENGNDFIADVMPSKIWVCHCEQCRYVKNKRKNRKLKKKVKRLLNKKRRKEVGTGVVFYWA